MTIQLTLSGAEHDLGDGFVIRRLLPSSKRQSVGPFLFFDYFGPTIIQPGKGMNVRPHPHIGLSTVTYLFEGAMMHRDSLGFVQQVNPGDINWMTSGSGIVHSEREPESLRNTSYPLHGIQLWAALPKDKEEVAPNFIHTPADQLPSFKKDDADVRVLIGTALGNTSPVATYSDTLYLDVQLPANGMINLPQLAEEMAIYALGSDISVNDVALPKMHLGVLAAENNYCIRTNSATRLVILGGAPLDGKRFIWWNFVSSSKERILQAGEDWQQQRLGKVAGDDEFIPLPPMNVKL